MMSTASDKDINLSVVGRLIAEVISGDRKQIMSTKDWDVEAVVLGINDKPVDPTPDPYDYTHYRLKGEGDYCAAWKEFFGKLADVQADGDVIFWRSMPVISCEDDFQTQTKKYCIFARFSIGVKR